MKKIIMIILTFTWLQSASFADTLDIPLPIEHQSLLQQRSADFDVPYELALAVMHQETGGTFNSQLISSTNDYGLFQVNKVHHEWLRNAGYTNLLNPVHNIDAGLMILSDSITRTNTKEQALVMYNRGSGSAKKLFAQGIYSTKYSQSVLRLEKEYKKKMEKIIQLKVKEISEDCMPVVTPDNKGDAVDLKASKDYILKKGEFALIKLGVAIQVPEDYTTIMLPRSSLYKKYNLLQANSIGLIDNSYSGDDDELMLPVLAMEDTVIPKGTRICQVLCLPRYAYFIQPVDSLSSVNRGGFGSTGTVEFVERV